MEEITITIQTSNAAFEEARTPGVEVARILRRIADDFEEGFEREKYNDLNGNPVCKVSIVE